jgi:hypothetical protein
MSGYVAAQFGTGVAERGVKSGRQSFHAGGCPKCNQSNYQGIFDQILTVLLRDQAPQFAEEL